MEEAVDISSEIHNELPPITTEELEAQIMAMYDNPRIEMLRKKIAMPYDEIQSVRRMLLLQFIEEQLAHKGRYTNIFRTAKGSLYFVLATGESLRVKQDREELKLQPLCRKIFYVNEQQSEEDFRMLGNPYFQDEIIGKAITTVPCSMGVIPIEFGVLHMPEIHFVEKPGEITIEGDDSGVFASGFHRGHPVVEILQ